MERTWVVVVVGDINGFGAWTKRAAVTREIQEPFITDFYSVMQDYVLTHPDISFKYLGDGFQIIKDFKETGRKRETIIEFLKDQHRLLHSASKAVKECGKPAPGGFRMRVFSGYVYKLMVLDPHDPERKKLVPEYIDYAVNTAHRILQVNREVECLCDGKLVAALGAKRSVFRVRKLVAPSTYPPGVDKEDINGLYVVKL